MHNELQQNFALDLVRVTEAAALCASRWLGKGDGAAGLEAAVETMRLNFRALNVDGFLVTGGGEREWPALMHPGERLSTYTGPAVDVALDPVEGVSLLALGRPNAVSVAAVAPRKSLFAPGAINYMQKLVVPEAARGVVDLDAPVAENLQRTAKALNKDTEDLTVFVLDKPRHVDLIEEIRRAGARILLHAEGDVAGALMVASPEPVADMLLGVGGASEGVLTACALRGMGGCMLARLAPQTEQEHHQLLDSGVDLQRVYTEKDLVRSEETFFACTGISGGPVLQGVRFGGIGASTHSLVTRGATGSVRFIKSQHNRDKLMQISGLELGRLAHSGRRQR